MCIRDREWQREGFEMFGQMIDSINSEFVRYIMHVEIKQAEPPQDEVEGGGSAEGTSEKSAPNSGAPIVDAKATKADASAAGAKPAVAAAPLKNVTESSSSAPPGEAKTAEAAPQPKVNNEFENVGRNAPCPCGSGKKFKHCHGR